MADNTSKQRFDIKQKREVPISQDLAFAAMKMFPGYDQQTALTLYLIDQSEKQQKTDVEQTKLIQAQKNQNEKLSGAVKTIGQELDDLERQSQETDVELQRLKDLSGKLKPAADIQQQAIKVSSEELKNLEQQVMALQSQPGMNKDKFDLLVKYIEDVKNNKSLEPVDIGKIENLLNNLSTKQGASDELFNKTMSELEKTKQQLDRKEERFKSYISKKSAETITKAKGSAEEIKKYADIVAGYKNEIESLKNDLTTAEKAKDEILAIRSEFADELKTIKRSVARLKMNKQIPADSTNVAATTRDAAADAAASAISKAQAKARDIKHLSGEYKKQNDWAQSYTQQASQAPGFTSGDLFTDENDTITEDVRPAKNYSDKQYGFWLTKNLPLITQMFKNKFWDELSRKDPTYSDQQIAYTIEEYAPWLWNHEETALTKQIMDEFLDGVFDDLFEQPPEPEQGEFDFRESLDKIYEGMLDQIITKTLKKH